MLEPIFHHIHHSAMAADILKQFEPHIRELIRICRVLNADAKEHNRFNELVQQISKLTYINTVISRDILTL